MAPYNVMITQANSELGISFVRQLLILPNPPQHVFAAYTTEENLKDLINIQEASINSKLILCAIDFKHPIEDGIEDVKTLIEQVISNNGLDLLINLICLRNDKNDSNLSSSLENHFRESTLPSLMLFQIMLPLLEEAALRNKEYIQETKTVFFNIIQDNSEELNPISETNKVALNLAMTIIAETVKNNVLVLSTCVNLQKKEEIENCAALNLLYALCSYQTGNSTIVDSSTVYELIMNYEE